MTCKSQNEIRRQLGAPSARKELDQRLGRPKAVSQGLLEAAYDGGSIRALAREGAALWANKGSEVRRLENLGALGEDLGSSWGRSGGLSHVRLDNPLFRGSPSSDGVAKSKPVGGDDLGFGHGVKLLLGKLACGLGGRDGNRRSGRLSLGCLVLASLGGLGERNIT